MNLDGFEIFDFDEGPPYLSVTRNGVLFNKGCVLKLQKPEFIELLINYNEKIICIRKCSKSHQYAQKFYNNKRKPISVRINTKDLLRTICDMMNWNLEYTSYRIPGILLKEDNAMLFKLKEYSTF